MSKHTPWAVDYDVRPDGAHQVIDAKGQTVFFVATGRDDEEEIQIAQLGAAAPELLEACNNALDALHDHDPDKAIDILCAVIDKAEGGE
jgi:hypothetical protein